MSLDVCYRESCVKKCNVEKIKVFWLKNENKLKFRVLASFYIKTSQLFMNNNFFSITPMPRTKFRPLLYEWLFKNDRKIDFVELFLYGEFLYRFHAVFLCWTTLPQSPTCQELRKDHVVLSDFFKNDRKMDFFNFCYMASFYTIFTQLFMLNNISPIINMPRIKKKPEWG